MEPIISPWLIYLLAQIDTIRGICGLLALLSSVGSLAVIVGLIFAKLNKNDYDLRLSRAFMWVWVIWLITFPVAIFAPSGKTLIGMLVAKNVTYNTVDKAIKSGRDFKNEVKNDIIEIIRGVQKEEKKK